MHICVKHVVARCPHYAVSEDALAAIRAYGTDAWIGAITQFIAAHGSLANRYAGHRSGGTLVPVTLPDGQEAILSPGTHNLVQKAIVEQFAPRFAPGSVLLYLGDTANKDLVVDHAALGELGLPVTDHDKLPDVVLFDPKRRWLFLIEAVTSHGPMTPKRIVELQEWLKGSNAAPVYVTAFPDMAEFRKHVTALAWETEVWIAELPDHMIHFNGDRFLGPR